MVALLTSEACFPVRIRHLSQCTVRKEIKCCGDSETVHEIVRDPIHGLVHASALLIFVYYHGTSARLNFLFNSAWKTPRTGRVTANLNTEEKN